MKLRASANPRCCLGGEAGCNLGQARRLQSWSSTRQLGQDCSRRDGPAQRRGNVTGAARASPPSPPSPPARGATRFRRSRRRSQSSGAACWGPRDRRSGGDEPWVRARADSDTRRGVGQGQHPGRWSRYFFSAKYLPARAVSSKQVETAADRHSGYLSESRSGAMGQAGRRAPTARGRAPRALSGGGMGMGTARTGSGGDAPAGSASKGAEPRNLQKSTCSCDITVRTQNDEHCPLNRTSSGNMLFQI